MQLEVFKVGEYLRLVLVELEMRYPSIEIAIAIAIAMASPSPSPPSSNIRATDMRCPIRLSNNKRYDRCTPFIPI